MSKAIERCRQLVRAINEAAERCGAFTKQADWRSPVGESIYPHDVVDPATVDEAFLRRLQHERQIFTGDDFVDDVAHARFGDFGARFLSTFLRTILAQPRLRPWLGLPATLDWSVSEFARSIRALPPRYICRMPPDNGGLRVGPYLINRETAAYQERVTALYRAGILQKLSTSRAPVMLEIGAGFGALAFCLKNIVPGARYIIADLPRSLVHAACWLAQWMPHAEIVVLSPGDAIPKADFVLIPHSALHLVEEVSIDLAINTLSFAEMPPSAIAGYADFIARHLSETGILFEQNFDNTGVGRPEFSNPAEVLHRYFPHRRILEGNYWRGVPSVWSLRA